MTPEQFVDALRKAAIDAAVEGTVTGLERPPGRRPTKDLVEASRWYNSLTAEDRTMVTRVLSMAAHQAVFGVLAVLDGARIIEDDADKGEFRLSFTKGNQEWPIVDAHSVPLHDILGGQ